MKRFKLGDVVYYEISGDKYFHVVISKEEYMKRMLRFKKKDEDIYIHSKLRKNEVYIKDAFKKRISSNDIGFEREEMLTLVGTNPKVVRILYGSNKNL